MCESAFLAGIDAFLAEQLNARPRKKERDGPEGERGRRKRVQAFDGMCAPCTRVRVSLKRDLEYRHCARVFLRGRLRVYMCVCVYVCTCVEARSRR